MGGQHGHGHPQGRPHCGVVPRQGLLEPYSTFRSVRRDPAATSCAGTFGLCPLDLGQQLVCAGTQKCSAWSPGCTYAGVGNLTWVPAGHC